MAITPLTPNTDPSAMPNYRHGVSNVTVAIQEVPGVYGDVWKEVGIQSAAPQRAEQSRQRAYSDNGKPATLSGAKGNDTLSVQFASLSDWWQVKVLGHKVNQTTGGVVKSHDDKPAIIAFGYQVEGTLEPIRVWHYGCLAGDPNSSNQSDGENVTEAPDTFNIEVGGDMFADGEHFEETCRASEPGYDTFLDAVPTYSV